MRSVELKMGKGQRKLMKPKNRSWFFKKINKVDKFLARLMKKTKDITSTKYGKAVFHYRS